ncbi:hypothetical protein V6N12_044199 [Hibiscus sabdariffa]|uniref:Uncharacterized protein n=1 Tax=Hibiscus sabdariffa TaxID=183260 RepID=A0ABR2DGJ5_9ROSI
MMKMGKEFNHSSYCPAPQVLIPNVLMLRSFIKTCHVVEQAMHASKAFPASLCHHHLWSPMAMGILF